MLAPFGSAGKASSQALLEAEGAGGASASPYRGLVFLPALRRVCAAVCAAVWRCSPQRCAFLLTQKIVPVYTCRSFH